MATNPTVGDDATPADETGVWVLFRKINPDDYPPDSGMPTYPGAVFAGHVIAKTCEAGSVIGIIAALVNAGARAALGKDKPKPGQLTAWCARGAGVGIALGVGMTLIFSHAKRLDRVGLEDRAYRLLNNFKQTTMDKIAAAGALGGAMAGMTRQLPGAPPGLGLFPTVLRGASLGVACGSALFVGFAASGMFEPASKSEKSPTAVKG